MLGGMGIKHIPAILFNSEQNGIAERFNRKVMNAVRAALRTTVMSWEYWSWALMDATDKYNQLPHKATVKSPNEMWFNMKIPDLKNLNIFGQLGFTPMMNKAKRPTKYRD